MEFHGIEMYGQLILEMSALPAWAASDEGRIIYDTTNDIMYIGGSAAWLKMADDADLQTHIGYTGTAVHGLGTISTQNSNNVSITGGTIKLTSGTTIGEFSIDGTLAGDSDDAVPTEKAVKEYVDSFAQGIDWQESVLSRLSESAAVQTLGNRYISTATSGSWTADNIYEWDGSAWIEIVPTEGFASWVEDEDVLYIYNGAWVKFGSTATHGNLMGLSADDHLQYAYLNGRSGGQILYGGTASGDNLQLKSTSNATKGNINIGENSIYDDVNHRLGINEPSPSATLDVNGDLLLQSGTNVNNISIGTGLGSSNDIICTQLAIKTYVDGRTSGTDEDSHYHDQRYFTETESDARFLLEANNLSDLVSVSTALTNLGLTGDSNTTHYHDGRYFTETESDARFLLETNNLSDLTDASAARTNMGLTGNSNTTHYHDGRYYTASGSDARYLLEANNLSDLDNVVTARSNLSLGTIALLDSINNSNWLGTDLAIVNGGTGASTASGALDNLGLTGDSNTTHYHDSRYFTETESDARFLLETNNLSDLTNDTTARSNLGLGSLAVLSSINNDNWSGTDLAVLNGGTGASSAGDARTNLGLGSLATESTINDNDWLGADLAIVNGGTGASTASAAISNLGLTGDSNTTHYHDGRYYTESETDGLLGSKYGAGDTVLIADGLVGTPGLAFNSDPNTGLYSIGADNVGFSTGGGRRMDLNDSGLYLSAGARVNEFSTDGTFADNSNTAVPTEQAIITYVTGKDDKIFEGDTSVECIDTGSGSIVFTTDSTERMSVDSNGALVLLSLGTTKTSGALYTGTTDPSGTVRVNYDGYFYASKCYNPVYNDIADFQEVIDEIIPGMCYYDTYEGAKLCDERCQMSVMGIASDTFGLSVGSNSKEEKIPVAISGWALAYVDQTYPCGTALTNDENSHLTEITKEEKMEYPERLIATYKKPETSENWGPEDIDVNGRHWVRII